MCTILLEDETLPAKKRSIFRSGGEGKTSTHFSAGAEASSLIFSSRASKSGSVR